AFDSGGVSSVRLAAEPARQRAVADGLGLDRDGNAVLVEATLEAREAERAHGIARKLLLAAPDHFHRTADGLGELDHLRERIGRRIDEVTAEEAAERRRVQLDLVGRDAGDFR